jgi:hypothetical protein
MLEVIWLSTAWNSSNLVSPLLELEENRTRGCASVEV